MAEDKVTKLYNTFVKNGYAMESEAQFRENLKDAKKRKATYNALVADGYDMEPYATFETNIGFGTPTQQPAAQPAQAAPASSGTSQAESATPATPQQSAQPAWQPTEQEKIQMSWQLHQMNQQFQQNTQAIMDKAKRVSERNTPEGRRKLKAAEWSARAAGLDTRLMGLTPPTQIPQGESADGQTTQDAQPQPLPTQSPVPYGVKIENGKRVVEWLMPDGSLTTNLIEADKGEYMARKGRLQHQFVNRMKANGLDPAKPEDIETQANYDAQAPVYRHVAELWSEAEDAQRKEAERINDQEWNRYNAMGGGREMRIVTTSAVRHRTAVSHFTKFDLEKMMDNTWARLGEAGQQHMIADCYNRLKQYNSGASDEELHAAATQMARSLTDNAVYQYAVSKNAPKSATEFFLRKVGDANILINLERAMARSHAGTSGDLAAYEAANAQFSKTHKFADVSGTVVGMATDPITWVSGGFGSLSAKGATWLGGRLFFNKAGQAVANRAFASTLTGRIAAGVGGGVGMMGSYEGMKEMESQLVHGGHVQQKQPEGELLAGQFYNPYATENIGYSSWEVLKASGHGAMLGAITGPVTPVVGNFVTPLVRSATSTTGKVLLRTGELGTSTVLEGTIFAIPTYLESDGESWGDVWSDSMALMLGFKAQHGIKSAPRVIKELSVEGKRYGLSFEERVRNNMDKAQNSMPILGKDGKPTGRYYDLSFTKEELAELRRGGYGRLADIFRYDKPQDAPVMEQAGDGSWRVMEDTNVEQVGRDAAFDGYAAMERLMSDNSISEAARAKAYYILTGRNLPTSTIMGYSTRKNEQDGTVIVEAKSAQGSVITSRTFKNEKEAQNEIDAITRQMEFNTVEIGEQYKTSEANNRVMDTSFDEVAAEFGSTREAMRSIYQRAKQGDVEISEGERQVVGRIDEAVERNKGIADADRPEAIRARIKEETGHDVDEILRKQPKDRTEGEQAVIDDYVAELYPERDYENEARYEAAQQEANAIHDVSRLLYGRYEQADPDAQAEIDAIYLRYEEAHNDLADRLDEATFSEVQENPWTFFSDPDMAEHEDALLYYINSRTAYEGVMQAHAEGMENKRAAIVHSIESRTHKDNGMIIPATMKVEDRPVYIVKGDVQMFPDGTAVDVRNSSESVVICDAESGEFKMVSPDQIFKVGEPLDAQEQLNTALAALDAEPSPFDNMAGVDLTAPSSESDVEGAPQAEGDAEFTPADTAAYDKGYEDGIEAVSYLDDTALNSAIEDLRGRESLTDEWRGRLEAYEYEQQRRAQEGIASAGVVEQPLTPAEAPAEEAPQGTALSRIPVEGDEPQFTKVDAETGWDGLVEMMQGDEKGANEIVLAQIQQARDELEKLKKKPPTLKAPTLKGSPVAMAKARTDAQAKYDADLATYNNQLATLQADIDAWTRMSAVYNSRNAEARAAAEAERQAANAAAHDAAVARFEEEQRIKAEKEAELAERGAYTMHPDIKKRYDEAPKVYGDIDEEILPNGYRVRYQNVFTDIRAITPSHDPRNNFETSEGFAVDEYGNNVNQRDYKGDAIATENVYKMSSTFDRRAYDNAPWVQDGGVQGGNNRIMSGQLAAEQGTNGSYIQAMLRDRGDGKNREGAPVADLAQFGKYLSRVKQIMEVFDEKGNSLGLLPWNAQSQAMFNQTDMKSQSGTEQAVSHGKTVGDETFKRIVRIVSENATMGDFFRDGEATSSVIGILRDDKTLLDTDVAQYFDKGRLSEDGQLFLEKLLVGKSLEGYPTATRQALEEPIMRKRLANALMQIAENRTMPDDYNLSKELARAIGLVSDAKASQGYIYVEGRMVSPFGAQAGLFDDEFGASNVENRTVLMLADLLNHSREAELRRILEAYNARAREGIAGQIDIFNNIDQKEDILKRQIDEYDRLTKTERAKQEAENRAKRTESARQSGTGESSEQVPAVDERNTGGAEPARVEPTEAQKAAGNYKKKHIRVDGHEISIENEKGTVRRGKDADGTEWATEMHNDYGYIRGTQGVDGDHIDVYLSDTPERGDVFVVDQYNPDGTFDEHKVMYGFPTEEAARKAYLSNYEEGWENGRRLDITHVSKDEFDKWIESSKRKTKPFAEYKSVKAIEGELGRPLTEQEAASIITQMESIAEEAPEVEFTPENWLAMFGEDGIVNTPIGNVKMGENQYGKLALKKRTSYFGMIKPTLNEPHVIIEKNAPADGAERDTKYLFVRTFKKPNGGRIVHFESITVQRDGMEVSISSHEAEAKDIKKDMQNEKILHISNKLSLSSDESLTEAPGKSEGPDLVPTSDNAVEPVVVSERKVSTLSPDKQESSAESSTDAPYTIEPATYVSKPRKGQPGKETPMHRVRFNRELTEAERRAVKSIADEAMGEKTGRFATKRGWLDREDGSWLFRTEEDARRAGEAINNPEAMADAQPLSRADIAKAAGTAPQTPAKQEAPRPANKVESLDELDKYWYTKGRTLSQSLNEAGLYQPLDEIQQGMPDFEVGKTYPAEGGGTLEVLSIRGAEVRVQYRPEGDPRGRRMCEACAAIARLVEKPKIDATEKGKLTITDNMKAFEDELKDLLGIDDDEVSDDVKFRDPGELTPEQKRKVYSIGVNYALEYFDQNITAFPDFAAAMVGRLGAKIKPWLKSFYEGAKRIPGYDESQFTPSEEVDRFDVANFDKPSADMIAAAETRLAERKAEAASQEAEQSIIEQRNQQRKEEDDKTTAGTVALAEEAGAVASEAESNAGNAGAEQLEKIDKTLDKVNERLALLGHYESGEGTATAEQRALQDATILAFELCNDLGLDEKALPQGVDAIKSNFHKMGGFVELNLPIRKDMKPIGVTIRFDRKGSAMQVSDITLTKHMGGPTAYIIGAHHTVMRGNTSYSELLGEIRKQFADVLPKEDVFAAADRVVAETKEKKKPKQQQSASSPEGQDLTTSSATDAETVPSAKVRIFSQGEKSSAKYEVEKVRHKYIGKKSTHGFLTDISTALGDKEARGKQSHYFDIQDADGNLFTLRISNHNVNAANVEGKHPEISIVVKSRRQPNRFHSSEEAEVTEYVYFKEDIASGDGQTLGWIAHDISNMLDTGKYADTSGMAVVNRSPEGESSLRSTHDDAPKTKEIKAKYHKTNWEAPGMTSIWHVRVTDDGKINFAVYAKAEDKVLAGDSGLSVQEWEGLVDMNGLRQSDTTYGYIEKADREADKLDRNARRHDAQPTSDDTAEATAAAVGLLKGGKKGGKSKKKSVTLQPDEPLGGLFADINDEAPNGTDSNPTGQAVAGTKRTHSVGTDAPRTDGGNEPDQVAGTRSAGDSPAKRQGVERGTDAEAHGTDADGGLQPIVGNRGRNESRTDSRGAGRTDVSAGTARPGVDAGRETDRGGERLPAGEPAAETGNGGRLPSVSKPKKPEVKYTRNFRYDESGNDADNFTPAQRLEANVKAVETIAEVLLSGKPATEEQKKIMSQFRGWGQVDLGKYYDIDHILRNAYHNTPIYRLAQAIQKLDPNGEKKLFAAIKRASLSSYYTPTPIARAMNTFLGLAGYKGGSLLDPSMGNGMFEGTLAKSIQERTSITGVELDWLSGQLSRALYPDANIIIDGFEKSGIAPGSFDVVTSNVPFGDIVVNDPSWKNDSSPLKRSAQNRIHNYYAVKMLEAARPGGLVAMMTTSAVMDTKSNQNIRAHIADQGEILGAIRLPDNTFQGTGVVTDIIFVRKWRDEQDRATTREDAGYMELERAFLSHTETTAPNKLDGSKQKVQHNAYYELNRRNMIGDIQAGDQYGKKDAFGLTSKLSVDEIANEVEKAIKRIVGTRRGSIFNPTRTVREIQQAVRETYKGEGDWVSNGNLVIQDGKVGTLTAKSNEYGETTRTFEGTLKHDKMLPRVTSMIDVRTAMKKLIAGQIEGEKESTLKRLREELQTAYDAFVKKYGRLRDKDNAFILDDIDGYTLQALEVWKSGKFVGLSDIFTKNSIKPALKLDGPKLPQEAVALSLAEYGYLRPDYMAKTLGENWAEQCGDFVFLKPNSEDDYVTREEYLSGDVVTKLAEARAAAEKDPAFERNVKALEEVQPARIPFDDIAIHLGARWIPGEVYTDFMHDIFGLHATARGRHYDRELGRMVEDFKSGIRYIPELDTFDINIEKKELGGQASDWETPKKSAKEILQAALEDKNVIIKYKDKEGNEHVDEEQTELANQKIADLREKFESWLSGDPQRVEMLEDAYNARFNRTVIRHFDGSHLVVPGLMGKELRPHQKDAVWMLINNRGGIVDHIVGAGKTLVMQSAIMEMRRMGIAKKPMIVALKSTVSQIAREFKEAFPSARVLAPNDTDFQKENRKKFIANISLNDYDCIILSHEQYCMLPHTEEAERAVIDEQMWQLDNMIDYLYGVDDQSQMTKKQIKALEKRRENLKARLEQRLDRNVDREFCFENLGIDYMFVDESHQFKSLPYVTSYQRVAGLGSTDGSSRAIALLTGIRHLQRMHQGDMGTVFLSGTTITNSLVEIYNILNYLRPRKLEELGMPTFDAWASTFAVHSAELEAGVTGNFAMKDRFRSFDNVPQLSQLYAEIADVRNDTNLKLPKPAVDAHTVIVPASPQMEEINAEIVKMLENKDGSFFGIHPKDKTKAPWGLHASTLSAKAAVSPRLIFPDWEDEGGKVHAVCENVKKYYDEMAEHKGVQLIFCEMGVPGQGKQYDAYTDIANRLSQNYGIPRNEIAFIQDAPNEEKRKELFQKVRDGQVRILIGGTKNMGTGVNVQDRITDMHMLTVPWTPSALEQCVGRGGRQGNIVARDFMGNKVRVHYYATEGSLDLYKYQLLDAKGKMFTQFKMGTVNGGRSFDEGSADEEGGMDPAEMVAILSGNPVIFERAKQEKAVKKLRALRNGFERDYQRKKAKAEELTRRQENFERLVRLNDRDRAELERAGFVADEKGNYPFLFNISSGSYYDKGRTFDKPKEAGEYLLQLIKDGSDPVINAFGKRIKVVTVNEEKEGLFASHKELQIGDGDRFSIRYSVRLSDDATAAGMGLRNLLKKIVDNGAVYARELEETKTQLSGLNVGDGVFSRQKELDEAVAKLKELNAEYNKLGKTSEQESTKHRLRTTEPPKNTGIGYKVFVLKDGKLYPPMVANADRAETPTGVWLDADANEQFIIGGKEAVDAQYSHVEPWLRRYQVAAGGKGTQGGSGALAYRPGWHLGEIPYALQFSRKNPTTGERDQFPAEFVWARVEYAKDVDYQQESDDRMWYDKDGKKSRAPRHALGGLNHVPENGSYTYRTNPNPETDPWIITGSMRVIEIVKPSEVDELVRAAGREPQQRQAGAVTDEQVEALNRDLQKRMNTNAEAMEGRALELAAKLNTGINVVRTQEEADALPTPVYRRSKGWFDPNAREGENAVTVVIPNNANVADVEFTVLHEVAGHKGLRRLVGEEKMNDFLDEMYGHMPKSYVDEVQAREQKMFDAEVDRLTREKGGGVFAAAEAHVEARGKREQFRRDATEEFLCDKSGEIGDEGFEKMNAEEQTFWGKIKSKVQKLLDNLLKGIKWAKSMRLSEKDVAYILYRSWKGMRAERSAFTAAEDAVMRRKTGWDADAQVRFRDPDMGLEETITRMKAEAMQANADNLQAKRDAMRAIGGNLNHLRQAMARQREYDITTVKSVADLAKVLMDAGLLDDMSKNETKRILGAIDNVVGRQDVSKYVQKVMDIMVDSQLRTGANAFGKLVSIRGSRVDARGIEVQGELDPEGQAIAKVVRKGMTLSKDDIEQRMTDVIDRMSSSDTAIADEAAIEYAGLQIAHQYAEEITDSKAEEKALRESIREAKADHDAGQMDDAAYKQYVAATEDAIRQNKIERAEAYHSLIERMGDALSASIERAKAWREAEKQRVQDIQHNANSDMEGRPTDEHHKNDRAQKLANNSGVRFLLAPLGTFDQMLRMFGQKNVRGEGYLWNRFMRGWEEASEREYTGYRDALKELDAKVSEVFGKKMKWGDLFSVDRKLPKASVRFWDGGEMKDHDLTQGNLLYIYMADKMVDGRMKLRKMGITEDDIDNIKNFLDPRFIELADWMQEVYLVGKRNEYNEVHKRMFGASMAAIENYFPLKILANARIEEVDIADDTTDTALPATSTGSIIKRRRNNLALDVTGANAFSVILDHLQQMERWAAFAEFNRDLNTLLSYKRFRNQVMNMSSVYGGGKVLWNNFRNVCSMAAGAYCPPIAVLDKAAVNIAKGVTAAKVSFRVFTALKQLLSMPAYISDSNPLYLAKNIINPFSAWSWCMKELPLFEKRWKSRMAGDPRLLKSEMDWKMWRSQAVQMASRVGMSPNAFVDALTVAIGTEAMYKTKLKKNLRQGYEQDVAEKKAKQDATILFNQTQQSSEGAFLSTMQVDRSWLSVLFTVFRNSSMSYTRQLYDAIRNQKHHFERGYKERSIEFMTKQFVRDGIDPDQARKNAEQEYRRSTLRDLARIGVFGFALQFAWNLGAYLPYLILGDDDEEKDKMMDDVLKHSYFGSIEGLTGGDMMSAAGQMALNGDDNYSYLVKDMPLASDITTILKKWPKDKVDAMNDVVNLLGQSALGVNPQSFTDAVVAVMDYCGDDANTSRECALLIARVINCPQSQLDKIYFDELGASSEEASQMTPAEIAERYAEYKTMRNAPLTGWAYSDAARDSVMTSHSNKALKIAKGKVEGRMATDATRQLLAEYDEVTQAESDLSKKKKAKDFAGYREGKKALREQHDMRVHNRVKRYKRDMKELTEQYLQSTDPQEADSLMRTMEACRAKMLEDVQGYTSDKPADAAQ